MARAAKAVDGARLAEGMYVALEAWPAAGWPPTLGEIARKADPRASAKAILSALRCKPLSSVALPVRAEPAAPVALMQDAARLAAAPATLEFLLRFRRTKSIRLYTVAQLKEKVTTRGHFKELFAAAVNGQIESGQTPPGVAWVLDRRPKLFLLEDLNVAGGVPATEPALPGLAPVPTEVPPGRRDLPEFGERFEEAFRRLDRAGGSHNFVSLVDLRRELTEFSRTEFDDGLHELRRAGRFGLSAAESYSGISPEQREAGIVESGSLLLHVSRKS